MRTQFIHSFNKYLPNIHYVLPTAADAEYMAVNKMGKILLGETDNKQLTTQTMQHVVIHAKEKPTAGGGSGECWGQGQRQELPGADTMWRSGGRMFQAEGSASAGALRRSVLGM